MFRGRQDGHRFRRHRSIVTVGEALDARRRAQDVPLENVNTLREFYPVPTIWLEDGTYTLPEAGPGDYTGLYFTTPGVSLRSMSGNPEAVIIDSA